MFSLKPKITIATHDGEFHADDVFAVAALELLLSETSKIKIARTRDEKIISLADYVVDVGGVHGPEKNRFDHHQTGGGGERVNGIAYASFGLVWKKYGEKISGSKEIAETIDQKLVQPVDAIDNGIQVSKEIFTNVKPFDISSIIGALNPTWKEESTDIDSRFIKSVELAKNILLREITVAKDNFEGSVFAREAYEKSSDKRLIILDQKFPFERTFMEFPEPLFVVYPRNGVWRIKAIKKDSSSFENRKSLPASWGGKQGAELEAVSGVPGALFCHNKLFMAAAKTKEAAVSMANTAINVS